MTRLWTLVYGMVLGSVIGACSFSCAHADDVNLMCNGLYVRVDTSAKTAGSWAGADRSKMPTYPATITDDQVTWTADTSAGPGSFTLDRHTGSLMLYQHGQNYSLGTCKKDSQLF